MAQSKQQIQAHLAAAGSRPRHRFGQNFMIDQNLVRVIADAADLSSADRVIEVGPGTGTLTDELLSRAGEVAAVEIDRNLAAQLRLTFVDRPNFELIEGDVLETKHALDARVAAWLGRSAPPAAKLVANLPYNIASPLVIELLLAGVTTLVFTVQKEVADRMRAAAGDEAYGPMTAMVQMLSKVEVLRVLPPQAFWPAPKIDSALVRMTALNRTGELGRPFGLFLQKLFAYRRKTLRKALEMSGVAISLEPFGLDGTLRPEAFSPEQLFAIFSSQPFADD